MNRIRNNAKRNGFMSDEEITEAISEAKQAWIRQKIL